MRIALILAAILVAGSPVAAAPADEISAQVKQCLSLPPASRNPYRAELSVTFKNGMADTIEIVAFAPDNAGGKAIADAAMRAVMRCGPYASAGERATLLFRSE